MSQDFSDQTVLKMPKIVRSDMVGFEAARQLQADSFDASPAEIFSEGIKRAATP
jgi:hypothetical protein